MDSKVFKRTIKLVFKWLAFLAFIFIYIFLHFKYGKQAGETFALFSGSLGLFVYGMRVMSSSLQKIAGDKLKSFISMLTKNPIAGMFTGIFVTALIQSSAATTVMVVGFVNAGIMSLQQAIRVILGANMGTTITAQLIAFNLSELAWPLLAIGSAMIAFCKTRRSKSFGEALLGFALLFLGMKFMGDSIKIYAEHEVFRNLLISLSCSRLLGVLAGLVLTLIIQSSTATVGFTMSLIGANAFGTDPYMAIMAAIPIVMGNNIGTCITAMLASIGTARNAKRTALAHTLFNVGGTIIVLPFLQWFAQLIMMTSSDPIRQLANAHSIFNVVNGLIFFPFVPLLEKFILLLMPITEEEVENKIQLDKRILSSPPLAIAQSEQQLKHVMSLVAKIFDRIDKFLSVQNTNIEDADELAKKITSLQDNRMQNSVELNIFLISLVQKDLTEGLYEQVTRLIYLNKDMDILSSQLSKLMAALLEQAESKLMPSDEGREELHICFGRIKELYLMIIENFYLDDAQTEEYKQVIYTQRLLNKAARSNHIDRIKKCKQDSVENLVFLDELRSLEGILASLVHVCDHLSFRL